MAYRTGVASALVELSLDMDKRHQELLELITAQSASVETGYSVCLILPCIFITQAHLK
jgi:hypothetical protein